SLFILLSSCLPLSLYLPPFPTRRSSDLYDDVYAGRAAWQLLPPFDHPDEPARYLVTGTGLTHKASAENRQAMHVSTPVADAPGSDRKSTRLNSSHGSISYAVFCLK